MLKHKNNSMEAEQFLNKLAVYGTKLGVGSIQQQLNELEKLIKNLSDINHKDRNGMTYLSIAVQQYKYEVIKLLLENDADPNIEDNLGVPPLSYVFLKQTKNTEDIVKLLLQHGADPTLGRTPQHTPLYYAKFTHAPHPQIELLEAAAANIYGGAQNQAGKEGQSQSSQS